MEEPSPESHQFRLRSDLSHCIHRDPLGPGASRDPAATLGAISGAASTCVPVTSENPLKSGSSVLTVVALEKRGVSLAFWLHKLPRAA